MNLKNIRSLLIVGLFVSLVLVNVVKSQETTDNEEDLTSEDLNAATADDTTDGADDLTEAALSAGGGTESDTDANTDADIGSSPAAPAPAPAAAAVVAATTEGENGDDNLTNLPSESAEDQAADKETPKSVQDEEEAAAATDSATDAAGAESEKAATKSDDEEVGTARATNGDDAATAAATEADSAAATEGEPAAATEAEESKDSATHGDDGEEHSSSAPGASFDTTNEKATEASDYGFGTTQDEDHATSDGTAEVAAENNTPSSEDNKETTADHDEGTESLGGATTPETSATEKGDDEMATTQDDEETSGDAQEGVTIGEKDPALIPVCGEGEFQCDSKCFSSSKRCDSVRDCSDGQDESDCPGVDNSQLTLQVNPDQETITVRAGETLQFTCSARGPFPTIQVLIYKDQVPVDQSDSASVQIRKENSQSSDGGQYLCYAFPPDRSSYVVKSINVVVEGSGGSYGGGPQPAPVPGGAKTVDAKVDSNEVLECSLSSEENANVRWTKLNGKLSEYTREYYGKLYIYYLKLEDSGEYECTSEDGRRDKVYLRVYEGDRPPEREPERQEPQQPHDTPKYAIRAYVNEPQIRFRNGQTIEQECTVMTNGDNLEIEWYNQRKQLIQNDARHTITTSTSSQSPLSKLSKLTITDVSHGDSGYYECRAKVDNQREAVRFELQPEHGGQVCAIEEATCRNGQCIPRSGLCDGRLDCSDGSDEVNCGGGSSTGRCEPNEKQCRNSKCIQKIWYCDGENDCGDNSDEDQCPEKKPGEICKTHEFLCRNGQQCVLKGFVCDGEYDCLDQSDESGCEKPTIVRGPIRNMTVYLGRTIRIECDASGFPAPFINWRLNWGHVCEEPRCVITNENGKGVLTISDARLEDAGAYSCEALNSKGRVFAVPDAIVYVLDDGKYKPIPTDYPTERPTTYRPPVYTSPPAEVRYCDQHGSYSQEPPCQCRPNREGPRCDRCIDRYFPLHVESRNPFCSPCFCNGLGVECTQANLFYTKIESKFADSDDGWRVDNKFANLTTSVDVKQDGIQFVEFEDFPGEDLFFYAPQKFLGNKLASYGGNLTFSIRYEGQTNGRPKRIEIRIAGSRVNIVHRVNRIFYPYYDYTVNVALIQDEFRRFGDNGRVDRDHMLMCLSDIQTIMIRASFVDRQHAVLLKQVSLDYAEPYPTSDSDKRAAAIELCSCPTGYSGSSCETCAPGYKRSQGGAYLGSCEKSNDLSIAIDLPNNRLNLRTGETRVVDVNIIGPNDSNEQIRWSKDPDSYLPYGVSQQGNNIIFNDANPGMAGTYTATLYTPEGLVKEQLFVTVQPSQPTGSRTPPSIYSPNQRTIELNVGEPFTLECVARGDPIPSIRIQPPEVRRQQQPNLQYANVQQSRPSSQPLARFEITYFTEDNAGVYTCIAENSFGEKAEERFVVSSRREERGPPTITVEPKRVEVFEGSSVVVNYTYTGTEPVHIKVEQYSSQPQANSNIFVNKPSKKIEINRISKDMQGQYVVEATNDYGTSSDYFELVVKDAPGPKIMVSETVIRTDVGTTLKIEPKVQYSGRPQFTWTKDGRPLPSNVQVLGYILYVPYVTKENQGVYTLTLVDDYGTAKIQVTIIVDDRVTAAPPQTNPNRIIVKHDMDVELDAGQSANLVCQIQPRTYNPRIITTTSWVKGIREQRERFPSNIRPNQERLQILRIKPSDAGMYTCVTISSDGSSQTAVVNIRVREGGSISSGEQPSYPRPQPPTAQLDRRENLVRVGDTFELTCRVGGSPTPRVQWLYNGQPIEEALGDQIAVHAVPGRYTLIVRDVKQDLNGYVVCRATSPSDGQSAEDSAVVRALPREEESSEYEPPAAPGGRQPSVVVDPRDVRARVGEATRLTCSIHGAHPAEFRFQWSKEGGYLPGGSDGESSDVLTLFNLQEQDSGLYVCRAENPSTGVSIQGSSRVVVSDETGSSVEDNREPERPREPHQQQEPLKVEVQPKEATLVQGREGEFVCNVQGGSPNRVITWKQTSGQLDPQRHRVDGNRLTITNAQASDRGYFECEVQSGDDIVRDYTRIEVESREAPRIEIYPNEEQVELDLGGTVYAQCRVVAGIPTPTVEWRRVDGRALSSKVVVSQEGSLLQISDAGHEEIGAYECVARNVEGETTLRLNIVSRGGGVGSQEEEQQPQQPPRRPDDRETERDREPYRPRPEQPEQDEERPPSVNILTPVIQVAEGETVNLRCETNSAPPFRIDWSSPNGDYLGSSQDGTYSIPNARASESGTYTCTVTNRYGNKAGTASVTIGDGNPNANSHDQQQPQQPDQGGDQQQQQLRVQVTPKSRTVTTGSQAEFTCDVQSSSRSDSNSNEEPIIRWSRAGGLQLPAYHQTRGNQLILYNIEPADAGRYQCTAQSADGSIEFDAAYLQVSRVDHSSPFPVYIRVREAPTDTYESLPSFRYGVRLTVECVAQTTDIDSIVWTKEEGVSRASYERVSDTENTMVIAALLPMDLGNYVCIARRNNGEKAQNSIEFKRHPEHGNLFTYDVQGASGPVDEHHQQRPHHDPYHRPSEEDRRGGEEEQPQHPQQHDDAATEPPRVSILGSKQVTVNEGDSAEIRCQVIGSNQVEISKHGEPLPASSRLTQSGDVHILNLHNLRESDRGYYLCNAHNSQGPARDYLYLDVSKSDNQAPPREPEQPQHQDHDQQDHQPEPEQPQQPDHQQRSQSKPLVSIRALTRGAPISLGQELRLACYVDDAEAQVEFTRVDGQSTDERRVRVEDTGAGVKELVIHGFEAADAGNYRCTARNRYGQSQEVAHIEAEADNTFNFKTDKNTDVEVSPGNPHVTIRARSTPHEQSPLDIECRLEEENGIPANSFAWSKYPNLPRSGRVEHNNLRIERFESDDNGLYTCRASTDENDYEKTKLIASNDYLLGSNPFFRLSKTDDGIEVKCRPESEHSTFTWRAPEQLDEQSYSIDGDRLIVYQSAAANGPQTFSCHLNTDSEFGPISIDLDVNQELIDRLHSGASHQHQQPESSGEEAPVRLYIDEQRDRDGHNSYLECQPGENC